MGDRRESRNVTELIWLSPSAHRRYNARLSRLLKGAGHASADVWTMAHVISPRVVFVLGICDAGAFTVTLEGSDWGWRRRPS